MERIKQQTKSNSVNQQSCSTDPVLNLVNFLLTSNFPSRGAGQILDSNLCSQQLNVTGSRMHLGTPASSSGPVDTFFRSEAQSKFARWPGSNMAYHEMNERGSLHPTPQYGPIWIPDMRCAMANGNAVEVKHEMTLSNDLIGCVIGRGGAKINDIRRISKAHIKISNAEEWTDIRRITVTGNPNAVDTAVQMIESSVHLHKQLLAMNIAMEIVYNNRPTTN